MQTAPNDRLNWKNGVSDNLALQTRTRRDDSVTAIENTPLRSAIEPGSELRRNAATAHLSVSDWQRATIDAVGVNRARAQRIRELVSHERVVAPFPGVITARNIDIGSLVSAGSITAIPVLYRLGRLDRMRIFVDVPGRCRTRTRSRSAQSRRPS